LVGAAQRPAPKNGQRNDQEDPSMAATPLVEGAALPHSSHSPSPVGTVWAALRATITRWFLASHARRHLEELDDHILRDIGLEPREARSESAKSFWEPYTLKSIWDR